MNALLVFDEGPGAGLGHRRRMEALALALHGRGWECRLAALRDGVATRADVLVVDSYRVRADDLRSAAGTVVAVDDLRRDLAVDVVVDPSPGADASAHRRAGRVLAGAPYALVSVPEPRAPVVPADGPVARVLVTTGAADADGVGARVAAAVHGALAGVDVRLVVGPWGAPEVPDGVTDVVAPPTLAEQLAAAPVVVTAGGVSMLEACLLGRAVVAMCVAENQRTAVEALARAQAVVPATPGTAAGHVAALAADSDARRALAKHAQAAIDGRGPQRVAQELSP